MEEQCRKHILVVDDDRSNNALVQFALKDAPFTVTTALNGREGLDLFRTEKPDLVVLDVHMPEMSGYEFIQELKQLPGGTAVPVIMLTANENMQELFLCEGVRAYLVKPVDPAKLQAKVREILG